MATDLQLLGQAQGINSNLAALVAAMKAAFFGNITVGTFSLAAAVTTTVNNANVTANSLVLLEPTNAAAATVMGSSKSLYLSAKVAGTSFTVATADGTSPVGTCNFSFMIVN